MFNKLYEKFKEYIIVIDIFLILLVISLIPLPYYIIGSDGVTNTNTKVAVENGYSSKGTFNISFITQKNANLTSIIKAWIRNDEDIEKQESTKTEKNNNNYYGALDLEQAKDDAIIVAYKHANKKTEVQSKHFYVAYVDDSAKTDLKAKDEIISINDILIEDSKDISKIVASYEEGTTLIIKVKNEGSEFTRSATTYYGEDERLIMGIALVEDKEYITNPHITVNFLKEESGPSGGLMLALEIYDQLTEKDYTNGLKIAGTGTIDALGKVGAVGGIKYKLRGAVDAKCDLFLIPKEVNYEEALKETAKNNYNIKIIPINTFEEAIDYLDNL